MFNAIKIDIRSYHVKENMLYILNNIYSNYRAIKKTTIYAWVKMITLKNTCSDSKGLVFHIFKADVKCV